ncbi:hypothetical protein EDC96DRAFT_612498 [Choanephora cucurbitarum]|nr:hypothetical protein EDC96DRAFT_612498 [Choanephora cucurbitarum]
MVQNYVVCVVLGRTKKEKNVGLFWIRGVIATADIKSILVGYVFWECVLESRAAALTRG